MNNGKSDFLKPTDLSWLDYKLFLFQAPEPNDVDWEFVHVTTSKKLKSRSKSWGISIGFMAACFMIIYCLSRWSDALAEHAERHKKTVDPWTSTEINLISGSISWVIVLFNKFIMGVTFHHIVDTE
jgi:hypothetical protein